MFLYLMRHGRAKFDSKENTRLLSDDGKKELASTLSFSSLWFHNVFEIWHSPLKRAIQTAEIVQSYLKHKPLLCTKKELSPDGEVFRCLSLIESVHVDLFFVTHMPLISWLFSSLLFSGDKIVENDFFPFACGTIAVLERTNDKWILCGGVNPKTIGMNKD